MKKLILIFTTSILIIGFSACKKENSTNNPESEAEVATHSDDEAQFSSDLDEVINNTNLALESNTSFSGRLQGLQEFICDANAVVDVNSNPMTITITYDGSNACAAGRTRTGTVVISMAQGTHWKDAGAAVTISFQNLAITRIRDNKSIIINGSQTYTNVSGGLLVNLSSSITHRITSSGLTITFGDGSQRSWQVDKQRVFTFDNGYVITTTGLHTDGNLTGIAEWGTNRFGRAFTTSITSPLIIREDCNFRLTAGAVQHKTPLFTATATFGLDVNGTPTTCPGTGNYYFKVQWTGLNGNTSSVILPY